MKRLLLSLTLITLPYAILGHVQVQKTPRSAVPHFAESEQYDTVAGDATHALRAAAKKGDVEKMKKYIYLGADVNNVDGCDWPHAGRAMLTEAIDSGSLEAVNLLLDYGATVESLSEVPYHLNKLEPKTRNVPQLSYAIMVGAPLEIIKLLIKFSKNLNASDPYLGWTPYKIAAFYKNDAAMAVLAKAGADTDESIPKHKNHSKIRQ